MTATIYKSRACGSVSAPPSKSMAHRLLICAGLSAGRSVIGNIAYSQDILATLDCLSEIGAKIERREDSVIIEGIDIAEINKPLSANCRESGSTLRFFIPLLLLNAEKSVLTGSDYLFTRPLGIYKDICRHQRLTFDLEGNKLTLSGVLKGDTFQIPGNISSQFISGLLFALPLLRDSSTIKLIPPVESRSYINMTVDVMKTFGVNIKWSDENTLYIEGNQSYKATDISVEGDYSNAAFLDAFNLIGGNVSVLGLKDNSLQGDSVYKKYFCELQKGRPVLDVSDCPDLAPILVTLAAVLNGAEFIGTKRLEIKESNRGKVIAEELSKFGADITVADNSITVNKCELHTPTEMLDGHNDHRIVMSLSVISSLFGGTVSGYRAVNKSYPDFFEKIATLNIGVSLNENQ